MDDDGPGPLAAWGFVTEAERERVVVVSPHPDDAVLSCGRVLAAHPGATVVTVFTGAPAAYSDPPTRWSRLSGFGPGDDVMAARREEDRRALAVLDATPVWLGFVEHQLDESVPPATAAEIADTLDTALRDLAPTLVLVPFGLANPEHVVVHDAALLVRSRWLADADADGVADSEADAGADVVVLGPDGGAGADGGDGAAAAAGPEGPPVWCCYQDVAYHHIPGQLAWRVASLFKAGLWPTPVAMPMDRSDERKRAALACYPSQVRALEADWRLQARLDAPTPEQVWRLDPPPPGWEAMIDLVP